MLALLFALAAATSPFEMPLLYPVTGDPIVRRDVVYRTDGNTSLLADIYLPRTGTRRPIAVFVHGGPLQPDMQPKNWRVYRDYGRLLAANGFVAVTFNHRFFEAGKIRDCLRRLRRAAAVRPRACRGAEGRPRSRRGVGLFRRRPAGLYGHAAPLRPRRRDARADARRPRRPRE